MRCRWYLDHGARTGRDRGIGSNSDANTDGYSHCSPAPANTYNHIDAYTASHGHASRANADGSTGSRGTVPACHRPQQ
jgi:hypothetical protein